VRCGVWQKNEASEQTHEVRLSQGTAKGLQLSRWRDQSLSQVADSASSAALCRYRRWRIQRHLRRCPPCTGGFSFESKLQQRIREDCVDDVPEELMARLTTFLHQNGPTDTSADPTAGGSDV